MKATKQVILCNECGKEREWSGKGRKPRYCSDTCKVKACRTGSNKVQRSRKTLEQRQAEIKARREAEAEKTSAAEVKQHPNLIPAPRGISLNSKGRDKKKPIGDVLKRNVNMVAPKEWFAGGLEHLADKGLTIGELIAFRQCYHAATGTRNPGLKDAMEVANRVDGKIPLPVTAKEPDREDPLSGLTEEELNEELRKIKLQIHNVSPDSSGKPN